LEPARGSGSQAAPPSSRSTTCKATSRAACAELRHYPLLHERLESGAVPEGSTRHAVVGVHTGAGPLGCQARAERPGDHGGWHDLVERDEPLDDDATDDDYHEKAGEIRIAKAFVDTTDIVLAMDALTSDHEFLASQIIDGTFYEQAFADWFDDEFGVMLGGDPVFVLDLVIHEKHRDPDCLVAAHAALDALSTFGGVASPLVTFHFEGIDPTLRSGLRDVGLWGWVHALRAKRWKGAYVTSRP
jgi:hypothetical protein